MARLGLGAPGGGANSATSQFFINVEDNLRLNYHNLSLMNYGHPSEPAGYTAFGKVVQGMDVVDAIAEVQTHTVLGMSDVPVDTIVIIDMYVSSGDANAILFPDE